MSAREMIVKTAAEVSNEPSRSISKFLLLGFLLVVPLFTACGNKDGGSAAPAATVPQPVAITATPDLQKMRHRASQCPGGIGGNWQTVSTDGVGREVTYRFDDRTLVEQNVDVTYIYDGEIRRLPDRDGMAYWYVGACKKNRVEMQMWATNGRDKVVKTESKTAMSRWSRLVLDQKINGEKVPYLTVFRRSLSKPTVHGALYIHLD